MYLLCPMCCICLKYKHGLKPLDTLPEKQLNCYLKIISEVADQSSGDESRDGQICEECVGSLYSVCEFIEVCQRSRVALKKYTPELQSTSSVNGSGIEELCYTNSVSVKTEPPSEDLHSYTIHNTLDLKPDSEDCLTEPEQIISEDTEQDINIKTEVETDTYDSLGARGTSVEVYSFHQPTSTVDDIFQDAGNILKQIDSFTDSNSENEYESTNPKELIQQKHFIIHTGEKPYECGTCKKRFINSRNLRVHFRLHTGEKPYECNVCKKKFSRHSGFTSHSKIHTGEKPFKCKICNRKFSHNSGLLNHSRTHTGEKPYECKICKKRFAQHSALINHSRIHTGEKPYECKICQNKFSVASTLTRHLRIHTGEKPYECKICKKKFSESTALTRHLRTHTSEKPYECKICKIKYSKSTSLKMHLKKHNCD